jgi:hypothetical protein
MEDGARLSASSLLCPLLSLLDDDAGVAGRGVGLEALRGLGSYSAGVSADSKTAPISFQKPTRLDITLLPFNNYFY